MGAWNGWYHVNGNTYGIWLPGDPRGWREKGHKKHVDGDYKDPPPAGSGDALHAHARRELRQPPVKLDPAQRQRAGRALVDMLRLQEVRVLALSLDEIHFHVLGKFPDARVRPRVGRAKKHATFCLRTVGACGTIWQRSSSVHPIEDRSHQRNVFEYIVDHRRRGAWVWTFRDGVHWTSTITPRK